MKRLTIALLLAILVAPATASADSLVFIKDANVWLAAPDGSNLHQVTTDGTPQNPYVSPSQADDGTIVVARYLPIDAPLLRLRQNGEVINTIPLAPTQSGATSLSVSPDGRLVAYEHAFSRRVNGYFETSTDVRFTHTDRYTDPAEFGETGRGAGEPTWIDSSRALVGRNSTVTVDPINGPAAEWFDDYDHPWDTGSPLEGGEYAAGWFAVTRGYGDDNIIQTYRTDGAFTSLPTPNCAIVGPSDGPHGRKFKSPTFKPGGGALAWSEGDGVWVTTKPLDDRCDFGVKLVIPGATDPDWGPADVNPRPRTPAPPQAPPAPPARPQQPTAPKLTLTLPRTTLARALRSGLKVTVTAPSAGRITASAARAGRTVATGRTTARRAGRVTITLRFTASARRTLRRAGRVTINLRVTHPGAQAQRRVTLR